MKIQLFDKSYASKFGLSRYSRTIVDALSRQNIRFSVANLEPPAYIRASHPIGQKLGVDLRTFFTTYPIQAPLIPDGINHLTTQQMGTLLWFRRQPVPSIITVHDIIPYLTYHKDRRLSTLRHSFDAFFYRLAMKGLAKAGAIIAISQFTKRTLIESLSLPEEKIRVILYGVDHQLFRPKALTDSFYQRYGLSRDDRHVVYVGSESPRKNLARLIEAFAQVKRQLPATRLIKVGSPEHKMHFRQLQTQVRQLGLRDDVLFVDHPPQEDLVSFYNVADVFTFPSLVEGFGLPPLEAMACGTPVITSNASSLPEVVGDAAILVDPRNVKAIAGAIRRVLHDGDLAHDLRERSLARAAQFSWERTAQETIKVYEQMLGGDTV